MRILSYAVAVVALTAAAFVGVTAAEANPSVVPDQVAAVTGVDEAPTADAYHVSCGYTHFTNGKQHAICGGAPVIYRAAIYCMRVIGGVLYVTVRVGPWQWGPFTSVASCAPGEWPAPAGVQQHPQSPNPIGPH